MIKRPPPPPSSSSSTSEDLESEEREGKAKNGKAIKRPNQKFESERKIKPAVKQSATALSTTPQMSARPPTKVGVTVSVQSTVSEVAKKSRLTVGEKQSGEAGISIELRRACDGAMTGLPGEGSQFAPRVEDEELNELILPKELRNMHVVHILFCERDA